MTIYIFLYKNSYIIVEISLGQYMTSNPQGFDLETCSHLQVKYAVHASQKSKQSAGFPTSKRIRR